MGEFTTMNTLTVKAKAQLAADKIHQESEIAGIAEYLEKEELASIIEQTFLPDAALQPMFAVAAFSSVVGCGIYRIGNPGKLIAMIPPQAPFGLEMTPNAVSARALHGISDGIKQETERVARLVLQALNAS